MDDRGLLKQYFLEHSSIFSELCDRKAQGWSKPEGDSYFQDRRDKADHPTDKARKGFFEMTVRVAHEMAQKTQVFALETPTPLVLDLCMAPGGFTQSTIERFPGATVHALTLAAESGGHRVMVRGANISIRYADITMFAAEFGVETIPPNHPDATSFVMERPYSDCRYELVFCGGAVVRPQRRPEYRKGVEGARLTMSQLIFAFHRIRPGGTLVLLLHRVEAWDTVQIIHAMSTLAEIQLFKPLKGHAVKSSFYLIARNVRSDSEEAAEIIAAWNYRWRQMTFDRIEVGSDVDIVDGDGKKLNATSVLEGFGPRLVELGNPIWKV